MGKRVCVFVDGENFRHSLCDLFEVDFDASAYLPTNADWAGFFDWLVSQAAGQEAERIRTYWYAVQSIDFYPWNLRKLRKDDPGKLKTVISQHDPNREAMRQAGPQDQEATVARICEDLLGREAGMKRRFEGWQTIQNAIAEKHRCVEFRRAGAIRYDLFTRQLGTEKAVDVKLATDMITLTDIYDMALVVSGDQDYVPAVKVVTDRGKHVVNVAFRKPDGRLLPGGARRLNQVTDWPLLVVHADMARLMNIGAQPASN